MKSRDSAGKCQAQQETDISSLLLVVYGRWVVSDSFLTSWTIASWHLCPWDFPDKNTGVGSRSLLQGIFPTQESNLSLCIVGRYFTPEPPAKPISSMVTGHCCWGFGCHSVVLLADLLLVPVRETYCFLPLFLGEKTCWILIKIILIDLHMKKYKPITKRDFGRTEHYKTKDKWIFISISSLSIGLFFFPSLV